MKQRVFAAGLIVSVFGVAGAMAQDSCREVKTCVETKTIMMTEPTGQYRHQCTSSEIGTICVDVPIFHQVPHEICARWETKTECPEGPLVQPK